MTPGELFSPGQSMEDLLKAATGKSLEEWIIEEMKNKIISDGK